MLFLLRSDGTVAIEPKQINPTQNIYIFFDKIE